MAGTKRKKRMHPQTTAAIRSVWAIARRCGLDDGTPHGRMSKDEVMRHAMVRAWLCGFERGCRAITDGCAAPASVNSGFR